MKDIAKKLWLNKVGEKHSNSEETAREYDEVSTQYCDVVGISLDEILDEWENVSNYASEKMFKKKHQS